MTSETVKNFTFPFQKSKYYNIEQCWEKNSIFGEFEASKIAKKNFIFVSKEPKFKNNEFNVQKIAKIRILANSERKEIRLLVNFKL